MPRIVKGVKTQEIAVQDTLENLFPHREDSVDFATGERSVQEESDLYVLRLVTELLPQHCGK